MPMQSKSLRNMICHLNWSINLNKLQVNKFSGWFSENCWPTQRANYFWGVFSTIHGWVFTACKGIRCSGFATSNFEMKFFAPSDTNSGILYLTCVILTNVSSYDLVWNGGSPVNNSKHKTPKLHRSTSFVCGCPWITVKYQNIDYLFVIFSWKSVNWLFFHWKKMLVFTFWW